MKRRPEVRSSKNLAGEEGFEPSVLLEEKC